MGIISYSIGTIIAFVLRVLTILVLADVIVSWVGDPNNKIVQAIHSITNPLLKPFRPLAKKIPGDIDWTPLIAFLILALLYQILVPIFMSGAALR